MRTTPVSPIPTKAPPSLSLIPGTAFIAHVINRGYLRSQAVTGLISNGKTQKEAISGGLLRPLHQGNTRQRTILDRIPDITNCYVEYKKSISELGAVPTANPWTLLRQQPFSISSLLTDIAYELPLVGQFFVCVSRFL
jgi:hypothetical protein